MRHDAPLSKDLAVVVLAAGQGTRMRSRRPKVLHPLGGRPMLLHVLASAKALNPGRIVVITAPGDQAVRDAACAFVEGIGLAIQDEALGTGHALRCAAPALADFAGDLLVLYGDVPLIAPEILSRLIRLRHEQAAGLAVLAMRPADPKPYGRLIAGADGTLERIVEARDASVTEAALTLCNTGIMTGDAESLFGLVAKLHNDNAKSEFYLTDVVTLSRAAGGRAVYLETDDASAALGVNDQAELARAEAALQAKLRQAALQGGVGMSAPETVHLSHDTRLGQDVRIGPYVVFGPGVTVEEGAEILGFCHIEGTLIEAGARVGPFARLRPGSRIGKGAHVGNFVELKASQLEAGAKANHLSYIGDAHVGAGSNIGAGTITCNYDGFRKARTEIGAGVFIGSNSALVAPVTIGDGAVVGAGSTIVEDVPKDAIAVARGPQTVKPGAAAKRRVKRAARKE